MFNKEVLNYVKSLQKKGIKEALIKEKLISSGYPDKYADSLFLHLKLISKIKLAFILLILSFMVFSIYLGAKYIIYIIYEHEKQKVPHFDLNICSNLSEGKDLCFFQYALSLNEEIKSPYISSERCDEVPLRFKEVCFESLAPSYMKDETDSVFLNNLCYNIHNSENRKSCLQGIGLSYITRFNLDISSASKLCDKDNRSKNACIYGIGVALGWKSTEKNISNIVKQCDAVSGNSIPSCFAGVAVSYLKETDLPVQVSNCYIYSKTFGDYCSYFSGKIIAFRNMEDIVSSINECQKMKAEAISSCQKGTLKVVFLSVNRDKNRFYQVCGTLSEDVRNKCIELSSEYKG